MSTATQQPNDVIPAAITRLDFSELGCHWLDPLRRKIHPAELPQMAICHRLLTEFIEKYGVKPFKHRYKNLQALFKQGGESNERVRDVLERRPRSLLRRAGQPLRRRCTLRPRRALGQRPDASDAHRPPLPDQRRGADHLAGDSRTRLGCQYASPRMVWLRNMPGQGVSQAHDRSAHQRDPNEVTLMSSNWPAPRLDPPRRHPHRGLPGRPPATGTVPSGLGSNWVTG